MEYINKTTFVTYTLQSLKEAFPNVYIGNNPTTAYLEPLNIAIVADTPVPATTTYQDVVRDGVEYVSGVWQQKWEVVDWPAPQIAAYAQTTKANKWEQIKAERDARTFGGVFVSGKWIHTDTYSRTQWLGMALMGASVPAVNWSAMDNTTITITPALVQAVVQAVAVLDTLLFNNARTHRAAMEASADPSTYDYSTGWPAKYEAV